MSNRPDQPQVTHSPRSLLERAVVLGLRLGMTHSEISQLVTNTLRRHRRGVSAVTTYNRSPDYHGDIPKSAESDSD